MLATFIQGPNLPNESELARPQPPLTSTDTIGVDTTSAHIGTADPLYREHCRIWRVLPALVARLAELEALGAPTEEDALEVTLILGQLRRLRRQSVRICELLRDEAWSPATQVVP